MSRPDLSGERGASSVAPQSSVAATLLCSPGDGSSSVSETRAVQGAALLQRASIGSTGRQMKVLANFVRLAVNRMTVTLYKVDMSFTRRGAESPDGSPTSHESAAIATPELRRSIFYEWMASKGHRFCQHVNDYAFDGGSIIVARIPFAFPASDAAMTDVVRCDTERAVYGGSGCVAGERRRDVVLRISPRREVLIEPNNLGLELTHTGDQRMTTPLHMLNVILSADRTAQLDRDAGFYRQFFPVARGIFQIPTASDWQGTHLGCTLRLWQGLISSVRACGQDSEPMVNVDVIHGVFHSMPGARLSDVFGEADGLHPRTWALRHGKPRFPDQDSLAACQWLFNNLQVTTDHGTGSARLYTCKRVCHTTAVEMTFGWTPSRSSAPEAMAGNERVRQLLARRSSNDISIDDYFRVFYRHVLTYPWLPLIEAVPGRGAANNGKRCHLPLEVLLVTTPQRLAGQLPADQGAAAILTKESTVGADQRRSSIAHQIARQLVRTTPDSTAIRDRFGISLANGFVVTRARLLSPPLVVFGDNVRVAPRNSLFSPPVGDIVPFYVSRPISTFAIIFISGTEPHGVTAQVLGEFTMLIGGYARAYHGDCQTVAAHTAWARPNSVKEALTACCVGAMQQAGEEKPSVIFCILPDRSRGSYDKLKHIADVEVGITTQCLRISTAAAMMRRPDTRANVFRKINVKLGGVNFAPDAVANVDVLDMMAGKGEATMMVGIDVSHPSTNGIDSTQPSVAAVVASMDVALLVYRTVLRVQDTPGAERVDVHDALCELLTAWDRANPTTVLRHIIVLRDGVSDGQMAQIVALEAGAIQQAVETLNLSADITFIVVNKRHHTRFFPMDSSDPKQVSGRQKNVLPGLVVDRDVTDPQFFDWYQAPQLSDRGTTRPVKYTCLRNDAGLTADFMQHLVHTLCYSFQRSTRAVHYPSPVNYAHLAAERGSSYLHGCSEQGSSASESDSSGANIIKVHPDIESKGMYFV